MNYITSTTSTEPVLMRHASTEDSARIRTLALLDDKRIPAGPFLVAEAGGEIVAARSLSTGAVVADPFRLTSDIVAMLRLRANQVGAVNELSARRTRRSHHSAHALAA
ncbi:MAG: hypothetical protein QOC77_3649 [Thermoleophilaceae bacterium]|nr:hypothetical protein [Thermoleophilaceae bacterium]